MPTVQVNGITIYYEVHGAGDPLLLIGGLGSDVTLLGAVLAGLAERRKVIAFDNRGSGRTDKPDVPYSIEQMAADAAGLLDALAVERADVLGVSMGGRIALELALSHPGRVRRLVLVSTSATGRRKLTMSWQARLLLPVRWIGLLRSKYPQPRYAHQRQRQASADYDAAGRLSQIHAPTLIAHGRRDKSEPLELAQSMHAAIAGSQLAVFPGGHMFFLFSQRRFLLDRVERFLSARAGGDGVVRIAGTRLVLRALRPEEIDEEWQAMVTADPMTIGGVLDEASFRARLTRSGRLQDGWLDLAIDLGGTSIGRIQTFVPGERPLPPGTFDVGIGLRSESRGQGFGREALDLLTDWLFTHAAAEVVQAPTDPANVAMRTVFDRVGWELVGPHFEIDREWVMYRITRSQWQARRAG
jgi:pimeloyl-ACP methyl ester carboxylesterase/RimJ/RimL family protein N-acetyltransferase